MSEKKISSLLKAADADGSGEISFDEFALLLGLGESEIKEMKEESKGEQVPVEESEASSRARKDT